MPAVLPLDFLSLLQYDYIYFYIPSFSNRYTVFHIYGYIVIYWNIGGHYFGNKGLSSQGYGFSSGHVWMWELDCEESWAPKNWCLLTVVLEKTLESPLDCKEIQPVHPKGNQSWIFIGRTDIEAEAPVLSPLMQRSDSLERSLMLGKIEGRR